MPAAGVRGGNWLTRDQTEQLLRLPDVSKAKGRREQALLALFVGCGLRRSELAVLAVGHIQQRHGRWVIVDLIGKGRRVRSVPMPSWAKAAVDRWIKPAGITQGRILRAINKADRMVSDRMTPQSIFEIVRRYSRALGVAVAPQDLRRTFAKLAQRGMAPVEQIQLWLGHASLQTTERYLGRIRTSWTRRATGLGCGYEPRNGGVSDGQGAPIDELQELLGVLDYQRSPHFLAGDTLRLDHDFGHLYRKAEGGCSLKGVYALQGVDPSAPGSNTPVVYVCEANSVTEADLIHRRVWNQNVVPFLLVRCPSEVRLYSGFRYKRETLEEGSSTAAARGILRAAIQFNEVASVLQSFRAAAIDDGDLWQEWNEAVTPEARVDWQLLSSSTVSISGCLRMEFKIGSSPML